MKSFRSLPALIAGLTLATHAFAQHSHLEIGATDASPGSALFFATGEDFETGSGYEKPLLPADSGTTYEGYFHGNITFTVRAATAQFGGPEPFAPAVGTRVSAELVSVDGPFGGAFAFWETDATEPTFSVNSGFNGTGERWWISENDGVAGSDPYGHVHGRRFTVTRPGVYHVTFRAWDESTHGEGGQPLHAPSEPITIRFTAGTPTLWTGVPMQGAMSHVDVEYADHDDEPHFHLHVSAEPPILAPLVVSHPGTQFDPKSPWFADLDPSTVGAAFNRQYGFVVDPASVTLPADRSIRIRMLSSTEGLRVYRHRETPATWEPVFGTDGSPDWVEWNLAMWHPAFVIDADHRGEVTATLEIYIVDELEEETGTAETFVLTWNTAPQLRLDVNAAGGTGVFDVAVPASWTGFTLHLERSTDFTEWTSVASVVSNGEKALRFGDPNPPAQNAFYRVRPELP